MNSTFSLSFTLWQLHVHQSRSLEVAVPWLHRTQPPPWGLMGATYMGPHPPWGPMGVSTALIARDEPETAGYGPRLITASNYMVYKCGTLYTDSSTSGPQTLTWSGTRLENL